MLIKITDAAKHLGIHPDTLRRWANAGKIKVAGYTPGNHRLFRLSDFEALGITLTSRAVVKAKPTLAFKRSKRRSHAAGAAS